MDVSQKPIKGRCPLRLLIRAKPGSLTFSIEVESNKKRVE